MFIFHDNNLRFMPLSGVFFVSLHHQSNRMTMFKKTDPNPQLDIFTAPSMQLGSRASKIDICPFRAYQRSFRLFQGDFSKDIHQRSRLLCFTQNDHTGQTGFKICPFLKWAQ